MGESHNEEYYAVEDRRFLGDEGFEEEVSREVGEEEREANTPIETLIKEVAKRLRITPQVLMGKDRLI